MEWRIWDSRCAVVERWFWKSGVELDYGGCGEEEEGLVGTSERIFLLDEKYVMIFVRESNQLSYAKRSSAIATLSFINRLAHQ